MLVAYTGPYTACDTLRVVLAVPSSVRKPRLGSYVYQGVHDATGTWYATDFAFQVILEAQSLNLKNQKWIAFTL